MFPKKLTRYENTHQNATQRNMAQTYTLDGFVEPLDTPDDAVLFRKMCDFGSYTERLIAQRLLKNPLPNVVTIYDVNPGYIDMELLDVFHIDTETQEADIRAAIEQIHTLGVVYIDLKTDNFGYSHADGCWKLFDFDASGILKEGSDEWEHEPPDFYMYKRLIKRVRAEGRPLADLDALALKEVFP